jgi:hypothetical protein
MVLMLVMTTKTNADDDDPLHARLDKDSETSIMNAAVDQVSLRRRSR